MRTNKIILTISVLALNVACGGGSGSLVDAHTEKASRWAKADLPIVMRISDQVSEERYEAAVKAATKWNEALGETVILVEKRGEDTQFVNSGDSNLDLESGIYHLKKWFSNANKEMLAAAATIKSNGRIVRGDIHLNEEVFLFATNGDLNSYDYESVLLHEMGHFLGLPHNDNQESVMYRRMWAGEQKRFLSEFDITNIRRLYIDPGCVCIR